MAEGVCLWRRGRNSSGSRLVREFREKGEIADKRFLSSFSNGFLKAGKKREILRAFVYKVLVNGVFDQKPPTSTRICVSSFINNSDFGDSNPKLRIRW